MRFIFVIIVLVIIVSSNSAFADETLFYKEVNLMAGYSDRDKLIGRDSSLVNSVGFEDYRKFSNQYGDYLTTDLQVRLSYDSLRNSQDAWAIEIHNAWLEYKLGYGYNLKVGHFDPAFGLEPVLDTHGTILQTLAAKNIGFKKDWGVALKGALEKFDYKIALQLGSGMSIRRKDGSFLFTTRVGSPSGENLQYGISFLYGDVLDSEGMKTFPRNDLKSKEAILKKRIGLDCQYLFGSYFVKGEVAYGEDEDKDVLGYLFEIDYTPPKYQNFQLELQYQSWLNELDSSDSDDSTLSLGISYKLNQKITLRTAFSHDFNLVGDNKDDKVVLQFYYYGS
ncbi:MAG: hypothetical protein ISS45_00755 [Candidatus Omnitrophica bacterium]|nr:hypothetical protein [Candidatus Omnitrophota bacterium]